MPEERVRDALLQRRIGRHQFAIRDMVDAFKIV
jgi:hypothetical protein